MLRARDTERLPTIHANGICAWARKDTDTHTQQASQSAMPHPHSRKIGGPSMQRTTHRSHGHCACTISPAPHGRDVAFLHVCHVPPAYSPVYTTIIGSHTDTFININDYVPDSFTTPTCAAAARIHAPLKSDYVGNPWLIVLWNDHGLYNP